MSPALVFDRISKHYGRTRALDDVTFAVEPGEILGLVGPNGAGKTTAMQIATGFLLASSGSGSLMGRGGSWDLCRMLRCFSQAMRWMRCALPHS
jgi:ABC-type multidrug transport system ATPase subunit